jgi:hypothetical protein
MFTTIIQKFAQRLRRQALAVTVAGGMGGMALVAYFAPNLMDYFVSSSGSTATEVYPAPFVPWPRWP